MKAAPSNYILALLILSLSLSIPVSTRSQQLISNVEIQRGTYNQCQEYMVHDHFDNYYVGLVESPESTSIIIGDTAVYSHRVDPISNTGIGDFYLLRFSPEHKLTGSFVIDNAEYVRDFYSNGDHSFISMYIFKEEGNDSLYPIILGGDVVLDREGNREKGILIILDDSMKLVKTLLLTTGEIVQVAADGDYAYLDIRIPDMVPYILIDQDTVHNQLFQIPGLGYGLETIVLCKYDYVHEKAVWWLRIGNVGSEQLFDMELDPNKNLVIRGITSSSLFSFDGMTYVENLVPDKPFIGKYTPEGINIWGILNSAQLGEGTNNFEIDLEGNIYLLGYYWQPEYKIGDTTLFNPYNGIHVPYKSFVAKYNSSGEFIWISQVEGDFVDSELNGIAFTSDDQIIVSGAFQDGEAKFGDDVYFDTIGMRNAFLWKLDKNTGEYRGHAMTKGKEYRSFENLYVDHQGILNSYFLFSGDETIFGEPFSSFMGDGSGFMLKLTTDLTSSTMDIKPQEEIFNVYPNPVSLGAPLMIELKNQFLENEVYYSVYDISGCRIVRERKTIVNNRFEIETNKLAPGTYWIRFQAGQSSEVKLIIVI